MNSSTIAAVAPGLKQPAGHSTGPEAAQGNTSDSFANVLAGQTPAASSEQAHTGHASTDEAEGQAAVDSLQAKAGHDTAQDEQDLAHDPELNFTLPVIALEIALHARDQAVARANNKQSAVETDTAVSNLVGTVQAKIVGAGARDTLGIEHTILPRGQNQAATLASAHAGAALPSGVQPMAQAVANLAAALPDEARSAVRGLDSGAAVSALPATEGRTKESALSFSALDAATGKQSPLNTRDTVIQGQIAEAAFLAGNNAGAFDRETIVANTAGKVADLSAGATAAPFNPFAQSTTPSPGAIQAIATPVHQPGWSADFSRQVVTLAHNAHNGTQTAELRLDPPELGPLRISISLNEGMASALFVSAHPSVRQAIESALPQLSQQLAQAGISLGDTHVGEHGQAAFAFNDEAGRQQGRAAGNATGMAGADTRAAVDAQPASRAVSNNIVDTFA